MPVEGLEKGIGRREQRPRLMEQRISHGFGRSMKSLGSQEDIVASSRANPHGSGGDWRMKGLRRNEKSPETYNSQ